jgi:hypothetical protein
MKTAWGPDCGDRGQALVSIDDLTENLPDSSDGMLLPIPAQHALGPSARQDFAVVEGGEAIVRYEQESIGSDLWTLRDSVGYAEYVDAIARGIQHEQTEPPLTIGIKAPWGAGKTSLMRMIRARLEWPTGPPVRSRPGDLRKIHLTRPSKRNLAAASEPKASTEAELPDVTYRAVLESVKSVGPEKAAAPPTAPSTNGAPSPPVVEAEPDRVSRDKAAAAEDERRWRPTVWFNPWMYQTGEQVWAGLAHEIITQITGRMSALEREHFWLQLNRKRINERAVRRKIYGLVLDRVLPAAMACFAGLLAGLVLLAFDGTRLIGALFAGASPLALLTLTGWQLRSILGNKVGGSLAHVVSPATETRRLASQQLTGTFDDLVRAPDYERQTGFLYLVQADLERVLDLVATPERPIVVFIDDLDRCAPGTVVQVIEAINLFLAGEFPNSIFVVAMEPEMVAAHIEAAYGDLLKKVEEKRTAKGQAVDLGWKFLEKFVQLPLTLPNIEHDRKQVFFESLFHAEATPDAAKPPPGTDEAAIEEAGRKIAGASLGEAVQLAGDLGASEQSSTGSAGAAEKEAVRRIVEAQLSRENPDVQAVISYSASFLDPNPREIKRFVNVFRFFVMIQTERNLAGLQGPASLNDLAKLAVLGIRFPSLLAALGQPLGNTDGRSVFELLEAPPEVTRRRGESIRAAERRRLKRGLDKSTLSDPTKQLLLSEEFRDFMKSGPKVGSGAAPYL